MSIIADVDQRVKSWTSTGNIMDNSSYYAKKLGYGGNGVRSHRR